MKLNIFTQILRLCRISSYFQFSLNFSSNIFWIPIHFCISSFCLIFWLSTAASPEDIHLVFERLGFVSERREFFILWLHIQQLFLELLTADSIVILWCFQPAEQQMTVKIFSDLGLQNRPFSLSSPEGFLLQLLQLRLQLQVSAAGWAVDVLDGVWLVESLHQNLIFSQQTALLLLQCCHLQQRT